MKILHEPNSQTLKRGDCVTKAFHRMIGNYDIETHNTIVCNSHQIDDVERLASMIYKANQRQCNMIIINSADNAHETKCAADGIHLWWHPSHKGNGEFMLELANMLTRCSEWKNTKIFLKALVSCEPKREQTIERYERLSKEKRIPFSVDVQVTSNPSQEYLHLASTSDASLTFLSLAPPPEEASSLEYAEYLKMILKFSHEMPSAVFVLSADFTPM